MSYLNYLTPETDVSIINEFVEEMDLYPKQLDATKRSILNEHGGIWTVEMGLGKSIITVGILTLLYPKIAEGGFAIVCAGSNTIKSFEQYITQNTHLKAFYTTGEADSVQACIKAVESGQADCVICTHSVWTHSLDFNIFMYNNLENIKAMIYDECTGTENNQGYLNFIEIAHATKYTFPANATPLNDGAYSIYSLLYAVNATNLTYRKFKSKYCERVDVGGDAVLKVLPSKIKEDFNKYLINFNRRDVNAETHYDTARFIPIELTGLQHETYKSGVEKAKVLYGISSACPVPVSNPAFLQLLQSVTTAPPTENKIIFCWHQETSEMLTGVFKSMGIATYQMNGFKTPSPEEKDYIEETFNATKGAVLITSSYKGNNLNSANYVYVYETPPDIGQYIARAARGYNEKHLHLFWPYYPELESDALYKAVESCVNNAIVTDRDMTLAYIIFDEILERYPSDPRNA